MSDEQRISQLKETSWRRKLTPSEREELRRWLAEHPEQKEDWQLELALTDSLAHLPDAAVPSNFTALVLQAIETPAPQFSPVPGWAARWWGRRWGWMPRASFAAIFVCAALFSYAQFHQATRARLARSVTTVSEVASMPTAEMLRDFDAIRALGPAAGADEDLIRLMQ